MTELKVLGLHKAFGSHPVLAGLDLTVPAGSLTAILGPSGSGKTTLLRVLAGFDQADAGTVRIGGTIVDGPGEHVPPERRRIGYVPQEGSLFPHLSVAANVGFGLPARQRRGPKVAGLLEAVGLAGLGKRYPHQLSGGQQQRVALARALAIEPALVLLDEPFASLDAHLRAAVRADVQAIFRAAGTTAILVTHDQDEALSMADRVAVLRSGQIAQCAPPQELYIHPADPHLARFIGDANLLDGELEPDQAEEAGRPETVASTGGAVTADGQLGAASAAAAGRVRTIFGPLRLAAASSGAGLTPGPVTVLIRPEQLEIRPALPPNGSRPSGEAAVAVPGRVVACEYYGHDAVLRVRPAGQDQAGPAGAGAGPDGVTELIVRTAGGPQLAAGAEVLVSASGSVFAWPR
ncbi:MAG TPA: ABC transporter ATP-binding protein [Streptosporangiaceae bacterium]|nr:ABC transporter ATP-binding protein [Streptosporangiaceae bacterium]